MERRQGQTPVRETHNKATVGPHARECGLIGRGSGPWGSTSLIAPWVGADPWDPGGCGAIGQTGTPGLVPFREVSASLRTPAPGASRTEDRARPRVPSGPPQQEGWAYELLAAQPADFQAPASLTKVQGLTTIKITGSHRDTAPDPTVSCSRGDHKLGCKAQTKDSRDCMGTGEVAKIPTGRPSILFQADTQIQLRNRLRAPSATSIVLQRSHNEHWPS
ncbi:hypothetical protein NDU88_007081 [Pleurodeles waltl]|uniref:Uncharacterized protein n=1 Tax=Pleurodeles waltl TaxID=8319 RepID=A0AAV7NWC6_PLEWA|nr:hypothetical protein NDU88_007081 [Pleurodeles waltl]